MSDQSTGALDHWLTPPPPPSPRNGSRPPLSLTSPPDGDIEPADSDAPVPVPGEPEAGEPDARLVAMERKLVWLRGKATLQRDPAWLDVLSPLEALRERTAAIRIRGMRRRQQVASATAQVRLSGRERRAEQELARLELSDQLWQRRALARRDRMLDPVARLAAQQRTARLVAQVLQLGAVAGLVWTSVGVHDALVGPDGSPLAYLVETLFALPLLVLMTLRARAAQWGRAFPSRDPQRKVYALEGALLFGSIAINTSPVLPGIGVWRDTTTLLAHLGPPVLVLVVIWLHAMTTAFFAQLLADAHVDVADGGRTRLSADTLNVVTMVQKIHTARANGDLPDWEDTGLPSVSAIARYFSCEKLKAQQAHDVLELMRPTASVETR